YPMPMQTGIKDEMLTAIVRRGLDISEERLQMALRACCASLVYRTRMCSMRFRRDINGVAVEAISKEDKKHAWQQIVDYRLRHKLPQLRPQWLKGSRKKGPMKGRSAQPRKGVKPSRPVQASQPAAR
ncbi:ProQ/FINO family protein, partial [Chimaeribacter californicus]